MSIKRALQPRIGELAASFPAVVVTGARQVGKTTLLREAFPHHRYLSLDLPSQAMRAEEEPELFLKENPPPLLIDEVQYAPKLFRHLKVAIDCDRKKRGQYLLTGSQKFSLMEEISESLAGRAAIVELEGFSLEELTGAGLQPDPQELLWRGSFPELWVSPSPVPNEFYRSYLATYLERDVRQLTNISSLRDFERFLRACAARSGQVLNKAELARDIGITQKTVDHWLSVLIASNQVTLLEPFFQNATKRLTKSPKLFLNDTGLLCFLLGLPFDSVSRYAGIGALWESVVFSELRKIREAHAIEASLWFYRDHSNREVDFLFAWRGEVALIEAKWSEIPQPSDARSLLDVAPLLGVEKTKQALLCRTPHSFKLREGVRAISLHHLKEWLVKKSE